MNEYYGEMARAGQGSKAGGSVFDKLPPQPPVGMLVKSVDGLREISARLAAMADQLTGIEPESTGLNAAVSGGGGALGEVERQAGEINDLVGTMARHLSRIERRL